MLYHSMLGPFRSYLGGWSALLTWCIYSLPSHSIRPEHVFPDPESRFGTIQLLTISESDKARNVVSKWMISPESVDRMNGQFRKRMRTHICASRRVSSWSSPWDTLIGMAVAKDPTYQGIDSQFMPLRDGHLSSYRFGDVD
jgi:hypothetical protein